jgi:AcrR family transcriptional regulator
MELFFDAGRSINLLPSSLGTVPFLRNGIVPKAMNATLDPAEYARLPSGRHRLTREAVVASQRGRLLDATAQVVAEKSYASATVADIVARAGVSRRTFYEQFPDKETAFIAAYDIAVELVLGRLRDAMESLPDGDWRTRARVSVETVMEVLADEPAFARAVHIETLAAGSAALRRRAEFYSLIADLWRGLHERARLEDPRLTPLPIAAFALLTGGLDELIRERLRTQGAAALPELAEPALGVVFAFLGRRNPPRVEVRWDPAGPSLAEESGPSPSKRS